MLRKTACIAILLASSVVLSSSFSHADPRDPFAGSVLNSYVLDSEKTYYNDLLTQLSPAQKRSLKVLVDNFIAKVVPLKESILRKENELENLLMATHRLSPEVNTLITQLTKLNKLVDQANTGFMETVAKDYHISIFHHDVRNMFENSTYKHQ